VDVGTSTSARGIVIGAWIAKSMYAYDQQ